MRRSIVLIGSVALLLGACGGDDPTAEELGIARVQLDQLEDQVTALEEQTTALTDKLATTSDSLATAEDRAQAAEEELALIQREVGQEDDSFNLAVEERDEARQERDRVTGERDAAVLERDNARAERDAARAERDVAFTERDAAQAELDATRLRFDPQIQAAIAEAQLTANDDACAQGDAFGFDPALPQPDAQSIVDDVLTGLPDFVEIDLAAVQSRLDECTATGEIRATLTEPRGDGFWTVGLEIAPGLWRSTGTGGSCYWQRSPDGTPDDILDNHFGDAGGSVTIFEGEEFQTADCGTWEFAE